MQKSFPICARVVLTACLVLNLAGCATAPSTAAASSTAAGSSTASALIEAALPIIRTGAAVAAGAVLDFTVQQASTRTRLANEMYAAASAVYSLSGGTFPTPAQLESTVTSFGGSQADASYAQFSSAIASLYAAWYPKLATGNAKTASDLLNAVAGGIEDATQSYVTTPATGVTARTGSKSGRALMARGISAPVDGTVNSATARLWRRIDGVCLVRCASEGSAS
jgi:hypothetical protein